MVLESKKKIPEVHLDNIEVSIISFNITQLSSTVLLNLCSLQLFIFFWSAVSLEN